MAKVLCAKSGIEFRVDHFPIYLTQGEYEHPLFHVPLKRLWRYFPKWQAGELTKTDSFLLFLALLDRTEMVEFRCHVYQRPDTDRIIAANMENLVSIIGKISAIKHPKFVLPRFVISPETRDLANVKYWLQTWEDAFEDFCNGLQADDLRSKLQRKAEGLERLIKNPSLKPVRYARMLASWASEAGAFPTSLTNVNGLEVTISEYWQEIIVKCHTDTDIITIPENDLAELIEHCEENLDAGSIQAHQLFVTIRLGMETLKGFFSIGSPSFTMLGENDSVEQANLELLINSAPTDAPKRTNYPTEFAFIKAKMKWQLAQGKKDTDISTAKEKE
jgi:hypothetical protein